MRHLGIPLLVLLLSAAARAETVDNLYREAVHLHKTGDRDKARKLFERIETQAPNHQDTRKYLAGYPPKDAGPLPVPSIGPTAAKLDKHRDALAEKISGVFSGPPPSRPNGGLQIRLFAESLFVDDGNTLSRRGMEFLSLCRDFAFSFPSPAVTVTIERPPRSTRRDRQRGFQAFRLGSEIFDTLSLPPGALTLRFARGSEEGFEGFVLTMAPERPPVRKNEAVGPVAQIHARPPNRGRWREDKAVFDLFLYEPHRTRRWAVKIIEMKSGRLMKSFTGSKEFHSVLEWDFKTPSGAPARAGQYRVFLTAFPPAGDVLTDSESFVVKPPRRTALKVVAVPAPPVEEESSPARQWAQELHFRRNSAAVLGSAALELRQLADNLRAFPDQNALVEGMSDDSETDAPALAGERARRVRDALVKDYGIAPDRVQTVARDPDGEGSNQKVVVSFIDRE